MVDVQDLRQRLSSVERNAVGKRKFTAALREAVVAYVHERATHGISQSAAASELGLGQRTVWAWMRAHAHATVREVELVEELSTPSRRTFCLRLPGGAVIEGLALEDVTALVRTEP